MLSFVFGAVCISVILTLQVYHAVRLRAEIIRHEYQMKADRKIFAAFASGALEAIRLESECRKAENEAIRRSIEALPCQRRA